MKRSEKKTLQEKSIADLQKQLESLTKQLSVARMQFAVGKLKNIKLMWALRGKIAVIKTTITSKSMVNV